MSTENRTIQLNDSNASVLRRKYPIFAMLLMWVPKPFFILFTIQNSKWVSKTWRGRGTRVNFISSPGFGFDFCIGNSIE